ncbi:SAM-dependent methyltransferase [Salmonella enterica subsp. enterica serovar Typhi]|nr:SAM-dependent methyltransferase [Salmonella enterica subsp. enterica serovar Typhi]CEV27094.1 SAM-dependent methyltransferase [Salmonella enterica subsp. enterica serovar Typhi]CFX84352.1 SAM-dependent methyltransferase [Salmonella enterica subsp. enterica serovar Typhi]CFX92221.1 SAM-dependent methyltransferase [Salmonella enterica subsp. enterica serovar Typhi]CFY21253.1 SAM-dependent methyltransferase [Salmonella enterica subsp. enterica serovar Typhi]
MDISAVIFATHRIRLLPDEGKIPWDEPAFSQRMLENHLSQDHDWASRRLTVIEQQVTWITRQLPAGARILDLGCGPGFYTRLLAERGFHCTGVDFSPASITWARQQAQAANLNIDYIQQDIRTYHPTEPFDFIMMTFGELNVFSAADAQSLISHCAQWLKPDGKLLVEVHTFDEVKRQGMAQPGWQRCPHGLFLAVPHLLLTENAWDEEAQTSSTQFWAIAENGCTTRFGSQMKAWRDDEYISLLGDAGFTVLQRPDSHTWPVGETFAGKLFALLAKSLKPGGIILIGKPYWRQIPATEEIAHACGVSSVADFRPLPELVAFFDQLGYDVVEMVLADPQGWDRYEAAKWMTMRRWLEENPDDEFAQEVRTELTAAPKRHVTWTREYFGWGVFALIAR